MQTFLLDLWQDLREKRLAPVAVVLLIGLVAVPVLLAKPAADPGPAPVPPVATKKDDDALAALTKVKLGEDAIGGKGSALGVFDPDNPFVPPKGTIKKDEATAPAAGGADTTSGGGSTGTSGGETSSGGGEAPSGGIPETPPSGGGGQGTEVAYMYVVDLTFKANGRTRHIKGMQKLDMLPSSSSPLLIFMGVTAKGGNAVFLVDSTLEAAGEGRCKPSESECAFAYIGPGSEYVFTEEDGDTYTVKIDEIRKVKVSSGAESAKGAKARASVGPQRRFMLPMFADVVVRDSVEDSTADSEGR